MLKLHQLFLRTFTLIFFGILLSFSIATYFWSKNIYIEQIEKNLKQNIQTFTISLNNLDDLDKQVQRLKKNLNIRITVLNKYGKVIAETDKDKKYLENHFHRVEIQEAKKIGTGKVIRYSKTLKKELLYVAQRVTINNKIYYIRMADYVDKINEHFIKLSLQIFVVFCIFLCIAFLFTFFISIKIKNETQNILRFLEELSSKKPSFVINSKFSLEFDNISKLLNIVSDKLAKRNKQKRKQRAKLKLANKQKDDIISALSHEFKNPISVILGYSQSILEDEKMPKNIQEKFLHKIQANAHKISFLIDKLRLSVKLESGKQNLVLSKTNINTLILNVCENLKDTYKNREFIIKAKEDVILDVDESLFQILISNLLENALKYSQDEITIIIEKNHLNIIDKGIGISTKDIEKIKNKFYRANTNKWNNSLGLGLFISTNILKLHGFSLDISNICYFCLRYLILNLKIFDYNVIQQTKRRNKYEKDTYRNDDDSIASV